MRKSRFSEGRCCCSRSRTLYGRRKRGAPGKELCRKLGIGEQTFYVWKKKYAGMGVLEAKRVKQLEEENQRLKRVVADLTL